MGKIKSAVITSIVVLAIVVLAFFALFSWPVPGGVERYNSFISSIHLGGELSGEATTVLYPEGVISATDYEFNKPEVPADAEGDEKKEYEEKLNDYVDKYYARGNVYVEKEVIDKYTEDGFKEGVLSDAKVISARLGEKGYSAYTVSVQDLYTIKVTVPSNFSYSAYKRTDTSSRSAADTAVTRTLQYLTYNGELSLRNADVGTHQYNDILTPIKADITTYFESVSEYAIAGNYAVKVNLTKEGKEQFESISNKVLEAENDKAIGFYIGENSLLSLSITEVFTDSSFFITVDKAYAQDYAIVLNSVVHGNTVSYDYNSSDLDIVYLSPSLGENSAIFLGVALLLILAGVIAYSVARYRMLGLVHCMSVAVYSLAIIIALLLIEIPLTVAGAFTAVLGLAILCASNYAVFENVRKETKKGKTMNSAIKSGYKNMLTGILEMHIVLLAVSIILALVCKGAMAGCGLILIIATLASYVLYWFTRFMWFVVSSPVRNKFKFGGYTREEQDD